MLSPIYHSGFVHWVVLLIEIRYSQNRSVGALLFGSVFMSCLGKRTLLYLLHEKIQMSSCVLSSSE